MKSVSYEISVLLNKGTICTSCRLFARICTHRPSRYLHKLNFQNLLLLPITCTKILKTCILFVGMACCSPASASIIPPIVAPHGSTQVRERERERERARARERERERERV